MSTVAQKEFYASIGQPIDWVVRTEDSTIMS